MGMRNHTYQLEVERQTGGSLKILTATQLVNINQHAHRYEPVNKSAFNAVMNGPKAARRTTSVGAKTKRRT
jgi:hypothetical protein